MSIFLKYKKIIIKTIILNQKFNFYFRFIKKMIHFIQIYVSSPPKLNGFLNVYQLITNNKEAFSKYLIHNTIFNKQLIHDIVLINYMITMMIKVH